MGHPQTTAVHSLFRVTESGTLWCGYFGAKLCFHIQGVRKMGQYINPKYTSAFTTASVIHRTTMTFLCLFVYTLCRGLIFNATAFLSRNFLTFLPFLVPMARCSLYVWTVTAVDRCPDTWHHITSRHLLASEVWLKCCRGLKHKTPNVTC